MTIQNYSKKQHTSDLDVVILFGIVAFAHAITFIITSRITKKKNDCELPMMILKLVAVYLIQLGNYLYK